MLKLPERLPEPHWEVYRDATEEDPAIRLCFAPIGPKAVRAARRAVAKALSIDPKDVEEAGDELSRELIRRGIVAWEGIGDHGGAPVAPTPDQEVRDAEDAIVEIVPGTISLFLADPDRFEWADRVYVFPWIRRDQEKNAYAASPSGTGAAGMQGNNTASSRATRKPRAGAKRARTSSTSRERTKASSPGK